MLTVKTYPLGPIQTNCYLIQNEKKDCLVIDPGDEANRLIHEIQTKGLRPTAILLTHAHFDHIGAVDALKEAFSIDVYIHENEAEWLQNPELNGSARYPGLPLIRNQKPDYLFSEEGEQTIGPFQFEVRFTPGHSPGSVTYVFEGGQFAVVGDTLFQRSIGRTDLPGGNTEQLLSSIHNKLLSLEDDTIIYPGHGAPTTPGEEKLQNPFLHGF